MKEWITIFLAWWVVPLTMIGFWLRYLPRHEWGGTFFHIALIAVSVAFAIIFYRLCALTLQGKKKADFKLIKFWRDRRFYYGMIIAILGTISMLLSNHAFTNWGADFREKDVSIKPNDYYKIDSVEKQIESVKGANLRGRNLKFADMYSAFLVKADLRRANLQGADLRLVDLQKANLEGADLQKAYLGKPNLQGANLRKANLQGATIWGANLQKADLRFANLQQADLSESDLQKANLVKANLQEANLVEANFKQADLELADLQKAKLEGTNFQQANLEWVNLQGAKNLTIEQLRQVKTLYNAKLDLELREQVIECCPQLLQELKKDTNPKK